MKYALIGSGLQVENIAEAGENCVDWLNAVSVKYAHVVPLDGVEPEPGIGWEYDPVSGAFSAPPQPEVFVAPLRSLSRVDVLRRIPMATDVAIRDAIRQAYLPAPTPQQVSTGLTAEAIYGRFMAGDPINPEDNMTIDGLQGLKALGLLTDAEVEAILA